MFIGVAGNKKAPPKGRANLKQTNKHTILNDNEQR
jgi:hypothetical protein